MSGKIIIGIDIGGSTTKIVGFNTSDGKRELIQPIFVKATDPITSVYGAFGKFLDSNSLTLEDIKKVMITGAGSSYVSKSIYNLPCEKIAEFKSIGLGGLYLSKLDSAIIASCGHRHCSCLRKVGRRTEISRRNGSRRRYSRGTVEEAPFHGQRGTHLKPREDRLNGKG